MRQQEFTYTSDELHALAPTRMHTADLIQRCRVENERCCCGQPQDARYAYELFRRACTEDDELAWNTIRIEYGELVEMWVLRCGGIGESARRTWLVAAAFARFRQVATPFHTFPTLTSLLHHLQFCAAYVVVDIAHTPSDYHSSVDSEYAETGLTRAVGE